MISIKDIARGETNAVLNTDDDTEELSELDDQEFKKLVDEMEVAKDKPPKG